METKKNRKAKGKQIRSRASKIKSAEAKDKEFSIPIYNCSGKEIDSFKLDQKLFTGKVNKGLLYQAIIMYNANLRQGNASTKTRGDVSGGGKKPWRQKGTGRARAGSTRSPLWRHGGSIFGPHPRDYHYEIPRAMRRQAFLSILNSKLNENKIIGIDAVVMDEPKTKKFKAILKALKLKGKSLFVLDKIDEKVRRSSNNLEEVSVKNYKDFNTMDVLKCDTLVISKGSLEKLPERVKG